MVGLFEKVKFMDIRENILKHSQFVKLNVDKVANEQDTKRVLVIPFLEDVLGIQSRDPHDLRSEYPADWGDRNHKAVDYALMFDEKPLVIIEVKMARRSLDGDPLTQLRGYFSAIPDAKFGILTDGVKYRFYADLDDSKGLDTEPFLEIDLSNADEPRIAEIERFRKKDFDANRVWDWAKRTQHLSKWQGAITDRLKSELADPSDGFVRFMMDKVNAGRKTGGRIEEFRGYIKSAISALVSSTSTAQEQTQPSPPQTLDAGWVPLSEFSPRARTKAPASIRFPNNELREVTNWRSFVSEVANWLYDSGRLKKSDAPIEYSPTGHINTHAVSRRGKAMADEHQIRNEALFVETHGDLTAKVQRCKAILNRLGVDLATVHVQVKQ